MEHWPGCPRVQFWDAGEFDAPCTCAAFRVETITIPRAEHAALVERVKVLEAELAKLRRPYNLKSLRIIKSPLVERGCIYVNAQDHDAALEEKRK